MPIQKRNFLYFSFVLIIKAKTSLVELFLVYRPIWLCITSAMPFLYSEWPGLVTDVYTHGSNNAKCVLVQELIKGRFLFCKSPLHLWLINLPSTNFRAIGLDHPQPTLTKTVRGDLIGRTWAAGCRGTCLPHKSRSFHSNLQWLILIGSLLKHHFSSQNLIIFTTTLIFSEAVENDFQSRAGLTASE